MKTLQAEALVIGGGAAGLMAAAILAERGIDTLIIEPNKTKARASSIGQSESFTISIVSTLISVATLIITSTK